MMHGHAKSDSVIVAAKPANKAEQPAPERSAAKLTAAEPVERRAGTEGNAGQQSTCRAQSRVSVSQALDRIRKVAKERKKERFTALFHHISIDLLEEAFFELKEDAAPGVDQLTWTDYEAGLECKLEDLHDRVQRGAYRALPSRRVYIPKPDGRQRPLAVAALEDKIVQRAATAVLNAIYEEDFLGFSYGFRPGRGAHDAMDALVVGIESRKVNYILDADVRSFFDSVSQEWLIKFVEHRIGDKRVIRLIQKWLKAGVLEEGVVTVSDKGTGQGAVISPLLANIYLHYVLDLWVERWRRREATGDMIIVRYADDFIVGFQHENDARRFLNALRERLGEFALSLHSEKTRLIEFGRFAAENRKRRGLGKPETFNFLGFTFICSKTRQDKFQIKRKSRRDRMRAKLKEVKNELRRRMHQPIPVQGKWLAQVVSGYFNYHAVPTNIRALSAFRHHVGNLWRRSLTRRSDKDSTTFERMKTLVDDWLPASRILHPWPAARFAVRHPRREPYARIGPVRICAGGAR
jgi:RNA-directed DNA polymerase